MMLLTLSNRLQLHANKSYIMKTLSKKAYLEAVNTWMEKRLTHLMSLIIKYVAKQTWPVGTELNKASKIMILFYFFNLGNNLMI